MLCVIAGDFAVFDKISYFSYTEVSSSLIRVGKIKIKGVEKVKKLFPFVVFCLVFSAVSLHAKGRERALEVRGGLQSFEAGGYYYLKNQSGQFEPVPVSSDTMRGAFWEVGYSFQAYPKWPWSVVGFSVINLPFRQKALGLSGNSVLALFTVGPKTSSHRRFGAHGSFSFGFGKASLQYASDKVLPAKGALNATLVRFLAGVDYYFHRTERGVWDLSLDAHATESDVFVSSAYQKQDDKLKQTYPIGGKSRGMQVGIRYWFFPKIKKEGSGT